MDVSKDWILIDTSGTSPEKHFVQKVYVGKSERYVREKILEMSSFENAYQNGNSATQKKLQQFKTDFLDGKTTPVDFLRAQGKSEIVSNNHLKFLFSHYAQHFFALTLIDNIGGKAYHFYLGEITKDANGEFEIVFNEC